MSDAPNQARAFFARHRFNWTPVFNPALDAQIADARLCIEARVMAWCIRGSWGNHSDTVCDANGKDQTQAACAKALGLDRRRVNPAFQLLREMNLIRVEKQVIIPVDDPSGFAVSSELSEAFGQSQREGENRVSFREFIDVWVAEKHPAKFKAYQAAGEQWKTIRTELLHLYDDHAQELSASPRTNQGESSEAIGQQRREPADKSAKSPGQKPRASLLGLKPQNVIESSSSFSVVKAAFETYVKTDDDLLNKLMKETQSTSTEDLVALIHQKGPLIPRRSKSPAAYLRGSVVNAVRSGPPAAAVVPPPAAPKPTVEEIVAGLERNIAEFPKHEQAEQWRADLAQLRDTIAHLKPKTKGATSQ